MKYIVCERPYELSLKQKPLPKRMHGESLLKIKRIGICGTDIHAFGGTQPHFNYPRILGHELAAEYSGALKERTFNIVFVNAKTTHSTESAKAVRQIMYTGKEIVINDNGK